MICGGVILGQTQIKKLKIKFWGDSFQGGTQFSIIKNVNETSRI